jgi:hypothetical protein
MKPNGGRRCDQRSDLLKVQRMSSICYSSRHITTMVARVQIFIRRQPTSLHRTQSVEEESVKGFFMRSSTLTRNPEHQSSATSSMAGEGGTRGHPPM